MRSNVGRITRYILLGTHLTLTVLLFLMVLLLGGGFLAVSVYALAVIPVLGYVIPALWLGLRPRETRFDRAGVEVWYLAAVGTIWLAASIISVTTDGPSQCDEELYNTGKSIGDPLNSNWVTPTLDAEWRDWALQDCAVSSAIVALAFVHVALLAGWLGWILYLVRHVPGYAERDARQFSVSAVLRGEYDPLDRLKVYPTVVAEVEARTEPDRAEGEHVEVSRERVNFVGAGRDADDGIGAERLSGDARVSLAGAGADNTGCAGELELEHQPGDDELPPPAYEQLDPDLARESSRHEDSRVEASVPIPVPVPAKTSTGGSDGIATGVGGSRSGSDGTFLEEARRAKALYRL